MRISFPKSLFCLRPVVLATGIALLSGCYTNSFGSKKIDYRSASGEIVSPLEVPPDLTPPVYEEQFLVPATPSIVAAPASMSSLPNAPSKGTVAPTVLPGVLHVIVEREGNVRWLVVDATPEQLWDPVKEFWIELGFKLQVDEPKVGVIETDWAENRAKISQDVLRNTLGWLLDSVYSTDERDRFRTRLERRPDGKTEIYVTHRGMIEVYPMRGGTASGSTVWQARPADPGLEAEILTRLMLRLGADKTQAASQLASASAPAPRAVLRPSAKGLPARIEVLEPFAQAWRRIGLVLDRGGFTVLDRNRSAGVFYVHYVEEKSPEQDAGSFASKLMFWKSKKTVEKPLKDGNIDYLISVKPDAENSAVVVLNPEGEPDTRESAQKILQLLYDQLR